MTQDTKPAEAPSRLANPKWTGFLLPVGFLALAVGLVATSGGPHIPIVATPQIEPALLVVGPRRLAMHDPPTTLVEGVPENCNACHQIFRSAHPGGTALSYHEGVALSHGLNNRCVNCHDPDDRERLTLRDGTTVAFSQTPQLCAQCHGTTFRDWERGMHGKTLGSWITGSAAQRRLSCNECHNPHSPRYEAYAPLPGPNTLRMTGIGAEQDLHRVVGEGPLQQWLRAESHAPRPPSGATHEQDQR